MNELETIPVIKKLDWAIKSVDKFCTLPWLNLNTNPNGNIKLCCSIPLDTFVSDKNAKSYNLGYYDIDEIWDSIYMQYVRERKIKGEGAPDCQDCYKIEKLSGHSPRMGQNSMWLSYIQKDKLLSNYLDANLEKQSVSQLPVSLELRLGNQCNLQCVSCWGMSSSLLHQERTEYLDKNYLDNPKLSWLKSKWKTEQQIVNETDVHDWFETEIFYNNFKKMAPTLRRLYTTGGEPTLIKANYKMFEMLLEANNTECQIEFTSNMTTWNQSFYSKLEKFKNVEIQMSIDGVGKVGEYIRYPSDFAKVRENVDKAVELASTRPGWKIKCYTVLQAMNFKHVMSIWSMLYLLSSKHDKHITWWPITLSAPEFLSLNAIPKNIREEHIEIVTKQSINYRKYYNDAPNRFVVDDHTFNAYKDSVLNSPYDSELGDRLKHFIEFNDKHRNLKGTELFKDIL